MRITAFEKGALRPARPPILNFSSHLDPAVARSHSHKSKPRDTDPVAPYNSAAAPPLSAPVLQWPGHDKQREEGMQRSAAVAGVGAHEEAGEEPKREEEGTKGGADEAGEAVVDMPEVGTGTDARGAAVEQMLAR